MSAIRIQIEPHPLLALGAFTTTFAAPLGAAASPDWLVALLGASPECEAPVVRDETVRQAVRRLLRHGGYKPTGRGKPASEYLVRAADEGALGSINPAVDLCNAVSLASGLPISVVDLDLVQPPLGVALAPAGASYVFNSAGQSIDLAGLLCLHDASGPSANAVKDSQRTKTHAHTTRTLSVVWASTELGDEHLARTLGWYRELSARAGATTAEVAWA